MLQHISPNFLAANRGTRRVEFCTFSCVREEATTLDKPDETILIDLQF